LSFDAGINPRELNFDRLDLSELFRNDNPVVLEIGSGKGRFLIESATADPGRNYLGIEKSLHYYRVIVRRLEHHGVANARIINYDAFAVLETMIGTETLSEVHVYFPDPWPRKRERKRRLMHEELLRQLERAMKPDALGVYVTDHRDYFEAALSSLAAIFEVQSGEAPQNRPPRTNYETKYRAEGRPIYEAVFRRRIDR
jgi:tRNA (guanine-N7-)-methyltransferase